MAFGALLGSILPSIIGGSLSLKGGKERNVAASAQAQRQMDFQERMSSSAHQREISDLRKAGLNPILSATGGRGASSPGGAQAPVQDVLTPAVSSALSARRLTQEISNLKATEGLVKAQTEAIQVAAIPGRILGEAEEGIRGIDWEGFKRSFMDLFSNRGSSARSRLRPPEGEKYSLPRLILRNLEIGGKR